MSEMEMTEKREDAVKRRRRWPIVLGAVALAIFFFIIGWFSLWLSLGKNARSLIWAVKTAKDNYYQDLDEDAFYNDIFDAFTSGLDPYSKYYTKAEYEAELAHSAGQSAGFGFSIWKTTKLPLLYTVAGNSPAEHAGLRSGMYIVAFGSSAEDLAPATQSAITEFFDKAPTSVVLRCGYQEDGSDAQTYTVTAAKYQVSYCLYRDMDGAYRFDPRNLNEKFEADMPYAELSADTAYIRISRFYGTAAEEFEACLKLMKERGRSNLIIDLRTNGGGYLSVLCDIAAYLLKDAQGSRPVVATAKYRNGTATKFFASANEYDSYFGKDAQVYLLADENTASASECLIGALISYGTLSYDHIYLREAPEAERGENYVARTYGKGIMQSHFTDPAGNVLKLTVAEIFWPNGTSIHGRGVTQKDGASTIEAPVAYAGEDVFLRSLLAKLG